MTNYDFSGAKRAKDVPHLAKLQAEAKDKIMITLMLDNAEGIEYQTLINRMLREEFAVH